MKERVFVYRSRKIISEKINSYKYLIPKVIYIINPLP